MLKNTLIVWGGIIAGALLGYFLVTKTNVLNIGNKNSSVADVFKPPQKVVLGFLPFWLIDKAAADYSPYITELSYFNITIDSDGTIQKFTKPTESDPGWHALSSGKVDDYLAAAKAKGINLSLTVFSGDDKKIDSFLEDPEGSAANLVNEISLIMNQYGFTDLNLDVEKPADASPEARLKFTNFVAAVRKNLDKNITLTVDISPIAFVKDTNLADPGALSQIADYIVLMGYDYHNQGSYVTGPVAPESGAGIVSEFDIESAVTMARTMIPAQKLILGIPLYGYSWETIGQVPRSATIPASALTMSARSVADFLSSCTNCTTTYDQTDQESHTIYQDATSEAFHQIFYPDKVSTQVKVDFVKSQGLGGIALWALGYEDNVILQPLSGLNH